MSGGRSLLHEMVFGDGRSSRWSEWCASFIHVGFGVALALPGSSLDLSPSYNVLAAMASEEMLALAFGGVGLFRLVALWINGRWGPSPSIRAWGSAFGAIAFGILGGSFAMAGIEAGALSTAAMTYGVLAAMDLGNVWRAAADVGSSQAARRASV